MKSNHKATSKRVFRYCTMLASIVVFTGAASACSVCFGDPDDPQSHGLNMAILTLLGVLGGVMTTVVVFIANIALRIRRAELAAGTGDQA